MLCIDFFFFFSKIELRRYKTMLNAIITAITTVITGVISWITSAFSGLVSVFWDSTNSALTEVGILLIIGFGVSLVLMVLGRLFGLFRNAGR